VAGIRVSKAGDANKIEKAATVLSQGSSRLTSILTHQGSASP